MSKWTQTKQGVNLCGDGRWDSSQPILSFWSQKDSFTVAPKTRTISFNEQITYPNRWWYCPNIQPLKLKNYPHLCFITYTTSLITVSSIKIVTSNLTEMEHLLAAVTQTIPQHEEENFNHLLKIHCNLFNNNLYTNLDYTCRVLQKISDW